MNFDIWNNELYVYEQESVSTDEGEIMTLFDNGKGITITLHDGYELKEDDDGYGNIHYRITKKKSKSVCAAMKQICPMCSKRVIGLVVGKGICGDCKSKGENK